MILKNNTEDVNVVDILKNFLCVFDKNYNKNTMFSYKDNMDVFILAIEFCFLGIFMVIYIL